MMLNPIMALAIASPAMTTGGSDAARYVAEQARRSRAQMQRSHTFGAGIHRAHDELCRAYEECREPAWDGYQAQAVTLDTYRHAYRLLEAMPLGWPQPSVGAEPDGHLTLEWHRSSRRTLSVSVSPEGDLHFAALIGRDKDFGTRTFMGDVPKRILELIQQVCAA